MDYGSGDGSDQSGYFDEFEVYRSMLENNGGDTVGVQNTQNFEHSPQYATTLVQNGLHQPQNHFSFMNGTHQPLENSPPQIPSIPSQTSNMSDRDYTFMDLSSSTPKLVKLQESNKALPELSVELVAEILGDVILEPILENPSPGLPSLIEKPPKKTVQKQKNAVPKGTKKVIQKPKNQSNPNKTENRGRKRKLTDEQRYANRQITVYLSYHNVKDRKIKYHDALVAEVNKLQNEGNNLFRDFNALMEQCDNYLDENKSFISPELADHVKNALQNSNAKVAELNKNK